MKIFFCSCCAIFFYFRYNYAFCVGFVETQQPEIYEVPISNFEISKQLFCSLLFILFHSWITWQPNVSLQNCFNFIQQNNKCLCYVNDITNWFPEISLLLFILDTYIYNIIYYTRLNSINKITRKKIYYKPDIN